MRRRIAALVALTLVLALPAVASANHSWGGYHWARTANPFTLKVGDNVGTSWDSYLDTTISDWSQSSVLDLTKVRGNGSTRKRCNATAGFVEVCNGTYGNNGWLGVASVWASGTHITQGTVKLNDTYFNTAQYNTPAWRNLVSCQEVGHTLGLDHQDTNFDNANLDTCMDYTNKPDSNQHPNTHDYDELVAIYSHLDSTTTVGAALPNGSASQAWNSEFGRQVATANGGKASVFVRDLGAGQYVISFVIWA